MELHAYVHFNGNCEEAFRYYEKHLGGKIGWLSRYGESPMPAPPEMKDKILHARVRIGNTELMGSDAPPGHEGKPDGYSLSLTAADVPEAERIYAALAEGGQVIMKLEKSFFAERFAMLKDRFGVPWMVVAGVQTPEERAAP